MGSAWTVGWTARRRSRPRWEPGKESGTLRRHASTGPSPSPQHGRNCGNSTRQMKMDDPLGASGLRPDLACSGHKKSPVQNERFPKVPFVMIRRIKLEQVKANRISPAPGSGDFVRLSYRRKSGMDGGFAIVRPFGSAALWLG